MIYFDHHATTPLAPSVRAAIERELAESSANPSSVHRAGRLARARVEDAREKLARAMGAMPRELVFTSGGTEAVHLAVRSVGLGMKDVRVVLVDPGAHPALTTACEQLAKARGVGCELYRGEMREGALVGIAWVQHETGAVRDVGAICAAAREAGAVVVIDAVQGFGKIALDAGVLGASALAISAHKIGGPTGVGAAWIASGVRTGGESGGGGQERGLRAGTENALGIVGLGAAAENEIAARLRAMPDVARRRDRIESALRSIDGVVVNGAESERTATACHVSIRGVSGEEMVAALDLEGYCVSSGPACSSGKSGPSKSMLAMYPGEIWRAGAALRITLGPENTDDEVDGLCRVLPELMRRVRG